MLTGNAADPASAITTASALMTAHAGFQEVALIQVGSDTYLFASANGASDSADTMVKLDGVTGSTITTADFV